MNWIQGDWEWGSDTPFKMGDFSEASGKKATGSGEIQGPQEPWIMLGKSIWVWCNFLVFLGL